MRPRRMDQGRMDRRRRHVSAGPGSKHEWRDKAPKGQEPRRRARQCHIRRSHLRASCRWSNGRPYRARPTCYCFDITSTSQIRLLHALWYYKPRIWRRARISTRRPRWIELHGQEHPLGTEWSPAPSSTAWKGPTRAHERAGGQLYNDDGNHHESGC